MWGDTDFGKALGLRVDHEFWDFRPLLAAGALLFKRADLKFAAGRLDAESILLFGEDCLQTWKAIQPRQPAQTSATFAQAGQYVIRDSWGAKTDVAYFRCGAFGLGGEGHCAHAHSDLLSVVLWLNGQPLLVDSGTYMYHGEWRNYFRCSAAHNTVKVDQSDQAFPEPNFNWRHVKEARCISWDAQQVSGEFSFDAVTFRRTLFHPHRGVWCLDDVFTGNDEHTFDWYFNFAPGLTLQQDACVFKIFQGGDLLASIEIPFEITTLEQTTGWYSKTYAVKKPITTLHAQWHGNMSEQGISFHWRINGMHIQEETERGEYVTSV